MPPRRRTQIESEDEEEARPALQKSKKRGRHEQDVTRRKSRPSQGTRGNVSEDEEESEDEGGVANKGKKGKDELDDAAKAEKGAAIARMALFNDLTRKYLRREDITKRILKPPVSRSFPTVLSMAQSHLKHTLGLELYSHPSTKNSFILRSTLSAELLARASEPFDDDDPDLRVIDRGNDDEAAYGLLMVILSLIMLNGRSLSEEQLESYLKRLSLQMGDPTPTSSISNNGNNNTLSHTLAILARQGYILRTKSSTTSDEKANFEYAWGPRSDVEIGEREIAMFLKEFYELVGSENGEEEWEPEKEKKFLKEVAKKVGETEFKDLADAEKGPKRKEKEKEGETEKEKKGRRGRDSD